MNKFKNWLIVNKNTLIKILCWLLFMTFVVLFIKYFEKKSEETKENSINELQKMEDMNEYLYECYYNNLYYTGKVTNDKEEMYIEEDDVIRTLYYDNGWYEIIDEEKVFMDENVNIMKPKEIYGLLKNSTLTSKIKEEKFLKYTYKMSDGSSINVYLKDGKVSAADLLGQYCVYNEIEG